MEPRYRYLGGNYVDGENLVDFLKRRPFTRDIAEMHEETKNEIVRAISAQTGQILYGARTEIGRAVQSLERISYRLENQPESRQRFVDPDEFMKALGFAGRELLDYGFNLTMDGRLSKIDGLYEEVSALNSTFQWGIAEVLASLGGIRDTLEDILATLKKPRKTAAYENFDDARDAFERGCYEEALEYLDWAINGDQHASGYKMEWRFHLLRGIILLGSANIDQDLIDPKQAEESFLKTARYAESDIEIAKAYLQAGWSAYVQSEHERAIEHVESALEHYDELCEGWYLLAKFKTYTSGSDEVMEALSQAIDLDVGYIMKADTDRDFDELRDELHELFESKRQTVLNRILNGWNLRPEWIQTCKGFGLLQLMQYENRLKKEHKERLAEQARAEKEEANRNAREERARAAQKAEEARKDKEERERAFQELQRKSREEECRKKEYEEWNRQRIQAMPEEERNREIQRELKSLDSRPTPFTFRRK